MKKWESIKEVNFTLVRSTVNSSQIASKPWQSRSARAVSLERARRSIAGNAITNDKGGVMSPEAGQRVPASQGAEIPQQGPVQPKPAAAKPISVAVSPQRASIGLGKTQQFKASVTGGKGNTAVMWATDRGTIDQNGLFTAKRDKCPTCGYTPSPADIAGMATVSATSAEDGGKVGTAQVDIFL
jgi:hypothetical protein